MNKVIGTAILFFAWAGGSNAQEETTWSVNPRVLACSPIELRENSSLLLRLEPGHPQKELAIRRRSDSRWFYLVIAGSPLDIMVPLMSSEDFLRTTRVSIPIAITGRAVGPTAGPIERIFRDRGTYDVYVSENLESEAGGYTCTVHYAPGRPGSNKSFKPNPLRGSA